MNKLIKADWIWEAENKLYGLIHNDKECMEDKCTWDKIARLFKSSIKKAYTKGRDDCLSRSIKKLIKIKMRIDSHKADKLFKRVNGNLNCAECGKTIKKDRRGLVWEGNIGGDPNNPFPLKLKKKS